MAMRLADPPTPHFVVSPFNIVFLAVVVVRVVISIQCFRFRLSEGLV